METERICPSCRKPLAPDVPLGLCPECLIKAGLPSESAAAVIAAFVPPPVEEVAKLFPQFEILSFLGKGGMGAVYKGRQPSLDRLVALKVLPPELSREPGFIERFSREAQALARLNHPNIVAVHDFGRAGELPYLVMEFVDGANLRQTEQAGRLTPDQALAIVPQICEALQYAHNEGIVHRDIKPENLLLDKKGRVKITDFGIAKILSAQGGKISLTGARDVVGTPHYMAPEQIEKPQDVDHRADIYSLGVVFYEMLTGELPLGKFQSPSQKVQVDVRLDEVVLRTLEKEPARRYQQASEVKTRVENIASTPPPAFPPAAAFSPPNPPATDKIIFPAFLLAFFFGIFGFHRFYVGKFVTGALQMAALFAWIPIIVLMAITGNSGEPFLGLLLGLLVCACVFWALVDSVLLLCKAFTDGQGRRITNWFHSNPGSPKPPSLPPSTGSAPPPSGSIPKAPADNKGMITAPAIGLMVANGLRIMSAIAALFFLNTPLNDFLTSVLDDSGLGWTIHFGRTVAATVILFVLIPSAIAFFGATRMCRLRGYGWALASALISIISFSCLSTVVGIWALIILLRTDVKAAFASAPQQNSKPVGKWPWWIVGLIAFCLMALLAITIMTTIFRTAFAGNNDSDESLTTPDSQVIELTNDPNGKIVVVGSAANVSKSFPVGPNGRLILKLDRGDVTVSASDQKTVEIQAEREVEHAGATDAAKILNEEHLVFKQNGDEISVTAQNPSSLNHRSFWNLFNQPNIKATYRITVPQKFDAHVETLGGDIKTDGIQGSVYAKTTGGELDFNDIGGKVDGNTLGGDVHAGNCSNTLALHTTGGSIRIDAFSGPSVQANTLGGDVSSDFATAPKSDCELHTMGGNVTANLPPSSVVTINAHTTGGSVTTDLPVQNGGKSHENSLMGTLNGGGPLLKLSTLGGNIDVLKRNETNK
jgi:serine/threonine protein kinase/DUF4097 and DUF4098 domain-containing protein YvlB